ncbi:MAG TPA: hypothetical protein VM242_15895 [Acidimicrobiales bacterium]|jgi:hypothetical protein|nr:hypothetical protein [Acidimicrobiales bacterium]
MRSAWLLLAVPGTVVLLTAILALSAAAERRFLSARSLIVSVARARRSSPEFAEAFVARQFERILKEQSVR